MKTSWDPGAKDSFREIRDRTIAYRSVIVNGLSKMVYYIKDDTIRIVAFWDTRQEPEAQAAKLKE